MIIFKHRIFGDCVLRPTPFVSISSSPIRSKNRHFGSTYTITLTGTILPQKGSPIVETSAIDATFGSSATDPTVDTDKDFNEHGKAERANTIFVKQNAIRELFAYDGMKMQIDNQYGNPSQQSIIAYVSVQSIDFAEGNYINRSEYTITLTAEYLEDGNGNLYRDSMSNVEENTTGVDGAFNRTFQTNVAGFIDKNGGFVEDFSEEWSIETDEGLGETSDSNALIFTPRSYIITRNLTAVGRTIYTNDANGQGPQKREAWEQAKGFLEQMALNNGNDVRGEEADQFPNYKDIGSGGLRSGQNFIFSDHLLDLSTAYAGYNHSRNETINKTDGSVTITDRWVVLQSEAYENYDISIDSNSSSAFDTFVINGSIKGVSPLAASSRFYGGDTDDGEDTKLRPWQHAVKKYNRVSNNGKYDYVSFVFKRVQAITNLGLNPQPLSVSVSRNDFSGEITYSVTYDNRPMNIVSEASSENISVQDTYPGDVYSVIPVLGRDTGPVLQYIGGRTEYKRSVNINLQFDYTDIDTYSPAVDDGGQVVSNAQELINTRHSLLMSKPSLVEPARSQINNLLRSLSPLGEPNIRKCFVNPPTENWEPRTGSYSLSVSWTYELGE